MQHRSASRNTDATATAVEYVDNVNYAVEHVDNANKAVEYVDNANNAASSRSREVSKKGSVYKQLGFIPWFAEQHLRKR